MVYMCYEKYIQIIRVKTSRGWAYRKEGWSSVSGTVVISAREDQAYLCIEDILYKHTISHMHFKVAKHKKPYYSKAQHLNPRTTNDFSVLLYNTTQ